MNPRSKHTSNYDKKNGGTMMEVRVRNGDTLWYYSRLFRVPLILIIDSNPGLENPEGLPVGQSVRIPGFASGPYEIRSEDTLRNISQANQVHPDALALLNPESEQRQLEAGQKINLPVRVTARVVHANKPYDFFTLIKDLAKLKKIYPFMARDIAGKSVLGHPIELLEIGRAGRKVQINASFHANEWITTAVFMQLLNDYLLALTNQQAIGGIPALSLYSEARLCAVPMVNPDGVNLVLNGPPAGSEGILFQLNGGSRDFSSWKANIRGVDLNKQFPAKWEFEKKRKPKQPGPRDFPGYYPLSEPESKVMAALARNEHYDRLISLHTQGEEIYWGYEGLEPAESKRLVEDFARLSGYEAVQYIDNFTGYKDWFIKEFKKPGFTVELGKGENPLPLTQLDDMYSRVSRIFVRALM